MIPGDEPLMRWINGWPEGLSPFFVFLSTATKSPLVIAGMVGFLVWLFWKKERRVGAAITAVGWLAANEVCDIFKAAISEPRPCSIADWVVVHGVGCADSMGTASSHAANMMFVGVSLTFLNWRIGVPWLAIGFLVGLSRIYVGVHWPSQVLLGWLVGAGVAGLLWMAARMAMSRSKAGEPD